MAAKHLRVLMPSNSLTDHQVEELAGAVVGKVPGNKNFPNPPVDTAALQATLTDFHAAIAAARQGGVHATADKSKKKHDFIAMLRKLALYVQANCNEDFSLRTSSGFPAASTVRTLGPLRSRSIPSIVYSTHTAKDVRDPTRPPGKMPAPRLIAQVPPCSRENQRLGREPDIPTVENTPLALALYRSAGLEQEIPLKLIKAVAEVLAYVYKIRRGTG